jgi:hypothetical protein
MVNELPSQVDQMMEFVVRDEARRDKRGRLTIYKTSDGYEIAGISERYHPLQYRAIRAMLRRNNYRGAEQAAKQYIANYTAPAASWHDNPGIQYYLRDTAFNRGPRGAARILQMAVGVHEDGIVGEQTLRATHDMPVNELLERLDKARREYEVREYGMRAGVWEGMENRWKKVLARAGEFMLKSKDSDQEVS